jgi:hypothetical protein
MSQVGRDRGEADMIRASGACRFDEKWPEPDLALNQVTDDKARPAVFQLPIEVNRWEDEVPSVRFMNCKTLMRNGRDRRSENPRCATRAKSACFCLGPISGSHQGQQPERMRSKAGYMAAPERFAETSDSSLARAGCRPYLMLWTAPPPARKCHRCGRC